MYIPPLFRESDPAFIKKFLQSNAFATLVSSDGAGLSPPISCSRPRSWMIPVF